MKQPEVSIIVPVYKVEKYLSECIESILNQTYGNIRLILVDDGSPDNCGAICDAYAAKDSRVLALHKKNGGVSRARNYGLSFVRSEYLTFCDSDDKYAPDWIEKLVKAMVGAHADWALGDCQRILEDGAPGEPIHHEVGVFNTVTWAQKVQYCFENLLTPKHGWEIWSRLYRSEIIFKNAILFCETCGNYAEDLGFVLSYAMYANCAVATECAGYQYRIREGSMMRSSMMVPKLGSLQEVYKAVVPHFQNKSNASDTEKVLSLLHIRLLCVEFISKVWSSGLEPDALRRKTQDSVSDWDALEKQLKSRLSTNKLWNPYYSGSHNAEMLCHMRYLLGEPWQKLRLQCKGIRVFRPLIDFYGKIRSRVTIDSNRLLS